MTAESGAQMDNRLDLFDEGMVRSLNATGRMQAIQCVWVYERPIDMEGVRRFHRNFGYGMAGRRIERSPRALTALACHTNCNFVAVVCALGQA